MTPSRSVGPSRRDLPCRSNSVCPLLPPSPHARCTYHAKFALICEEEGAADSQKRFTTYSFLKNILMTIYALNFFASIYPWQTTHLSHKLSGHTYRSSSSSSAPLPFPPSSVCPFVVRCGCQGEEGGGKSRVTEAVQRCISSSSSFVYRGKRELGQGGTFDDDLAIKYRIFAMNVYQ